MVRQGGTYKLHDAKADAKSAKTISTAQLEVDLVPADEWEAIFDEVWRRYRDFFYVKNMHGYDWAAIRDQYRPWLAHVKHRSDLNYVIGEMIAELNVGHAYISGGDYEIPDRSERRPDGCRARAGCRERAIPHFAHPERPQRRVGIQGSSN